MPKTEEEINAEKASKPRPDLVPARAVLAAGRALAYGANKHGLAGGRGTYRIADTDQAKVETHLASCLRHILEFQIDPSAVEEGSGLSVLDHAFAQLAIVVDLVEDPPRPIEQLERRAVLVREPEDPWALPDGWEWHISSRRNRWCARRDRDGLPIYASPEDPDRHEYPDVHALVMKRQAEDPPR